LYLTQTLCTTEEEEERDQLGGLKTFPAIYAHPSGEAHMTHWPNVISIYQQNAAEVRKHRSTVAARENNTNQSLGSIVFIMPFSYRNLC
jgi:hypothetical protein